MNTLRIGKRLGTPAARTSLGRWVWLAPVLGLLLLGGGYALERTISERMKVRLSATLQATLDANVNALQIWLASEKRFASAIARSPMLRDLIERLDSTGQAQGELVRIRELLDPLCEAEGFLGFSILDRSGRNIGDTFDSPIGSRIAAKHLGLLQRVLDGETIVTPPIAIVSKDGPEAGTPSSAQQQIVAAAPVRNADGEVIAVLAMRINPEAEFTGILGVSLPGNIGETYAFDRNGTMISRSQFEDDLRVVGLLPKDPAVHSALNLELRDPGGDLKAGFVPPNNRARLPLTRMTLAALAGRSGVDLEGYRNYLGVPVIGAWTWLDKDEMGIAFEINRDIAFEPVNRLRNLVWGLFGLLSGATLVVLLTTAIMSSINRRMGEQIEEARRLGQYTLGEKIGEGGMGEVYRASHALLRRPTAIKLLRPERTGQKDIARFEREVQITAELTHPNTVRIFDYGKTSDNVFYYAMEYLPGLSLERMVRANGPLPSSRVIYILLQVCDSLREAHGHGLIHRDIKPANIILCERGGIHDVVKLLDFGIVRAINSDDVRLTADDVMSGTPQYLSPEGIRTPANIDARADLYAVGAVGYFLLTGQVVFDGESVMDVCARHLREKPTPPSTRLRKPVPEDLERLILHCLAKEREDRPASAAALFEALKSLENPMPWTRDDARSWWAENGPKSSESPISGDQTATEAQNDDLSITQTIEMDPPQLPRDRWPQGSTEDI